MAIVIIEDKVTSEQITLAAEDHFGEYIKIVVDIGTGIMAIGGEWHADAEKVLLDAGSSRQNLWGGGYRISTGQIEFTSLINTRPNFNTSQEILDPKTRAEFERLVKLRFGL